MKKYKDMKLETRKGVKDTYIVTGFTIKENNIELLYSGFSKKEAQKIYDKHKK